MERSAVMLTSAHIHTAIERSVKFLAAARDEHGWWLDFHLAAGWSDEWVTGYVGAALAEINPDLAFEAWGLLKTRREQQTGWGFNMRTPPDGDSTLWALRLATLLGQDTDARYNQAYAFLQAYRMPEGGLTTYASEPPIRNFIRLPWYFPMWGWVNHPHPCVTAAGAGLRVLRESLVPYLRTEQAEDGHWTAYWWCDPEYTTAQAAEALLEHGESIDQERVARALTWAIHRSETMPIAPFVAAWQTRLFLVGGDFRRATSTIMHLLDLQASDGSWCGTARLRIPIPWDKNPDSYTEWQEGKRAEGGINVDERRVFTTATVACALHKALTLL
jgi:hypothetical protein